MNRLTSGCCPAGKKKRLVRSSPSSLASPGRSVGRARTSQSRGTKQAGRRRSREAEEEDSLDMALEDEEQDEPSPKRC